MGSAPARDAVITAYAKSLIKLKAQQLVRRPGFSRTDQEDLEQQLTLYLLQKAHHFDPTRASVNTFSDRVIRSAVAMILRDRRRLKRAAGFAAQSLDLKIEGADGATVTLGQTLSQTDAGRRTGTASRDSALDHDTVTDVGDVLKRVPPRLRDIAQRLKHKPPGAVARDLGISRRQIRKAMDELRQRFEDAGLGDD